MKRLSLSIITGSLLGVICVIGASLRANYDLITIIGLWYNRVVMGLLIGLADRIKLRVVLRGGLLGLIVSTAFALTTGFSDWLSFLAGIIYGVIIDLVATNYGKK